MESEFSLIQSKSAIEFLKQWRYKLVFVIVCGIYFFAAKNNYGYYHPDEHYQIIEFSGLKLGWNSPKDLAWEYHAALRPTLQVWICFIVFKTLMFFGFDDPYTLAFSLRLITVFFSIICIYVFFKATSVKLDIQFHFIYFVLCYLLWFIPFVSVRFSSETWSGLFFLLGFSYAINIKRLKNRNLAVGVCLGLSFLFRFQAGISILGLGLWMCFINKEERRSLLSIGTFFIIVLQAGVVLDALFYGKYVYTFWNYFNVNIIESVASKFGTSPWTTILSYLFYYTFWPIGIILFLSLSILLWKTPCNPILWCILPFIFIHSLIPHKELRFLFPIVWFAPSVLMFGFQEIYNLKFILQYPTTKLWIYTIPLFCMNFYVLFVVTDIALGENGKFVTKNIAKDYPNRPIRIFHTTYGNPYEPWSGLTEKFYRKRNAEFTRIESPDKIRADEIMMCDTIYLFAIRGYEDESLQGYIQNGNTILNFVKVYSTDYNSIWTKFYPNKDGLNTFQVYEIKK